MKKLFILLVVLIFFNTFSFTQDSDEEVEFTYGEVVSVAKDKITIKEYDYESDKEINVVYQINSKTKLEGMKSINDIKPNDYVYIDYIIKNNTKIAVIISFAEDYDDGNDEEDNYDEDI